MKMKKINKLIKLINFSLKVDANSISTAIAFQPPVPKALKRFKNDK